MIPSVRCRQPLNPKATAALVASALYDEGYEEQINRGAAARLERVVPRGTSNPGQTPPIVGRKRSAGKDSNDSRAGRGVCVDRLTGNAEEGEPMEPPARSESRDCLRGGIPLSGDGRDRAGICDRATGVSVRSRVPEFPRNTCVVGCTEKTERVAGSIVL